MLRALPSGGTGLKTKKEALDVIGTTNVKGHRTGFANVLSPSSSARTGSRWPFQSAGKAVRPEAVEAAWKEYRATGSPEARETLMQRYIHLVRYMARRMGRTLPPRVEDSDLVSPGVDGLRGEFE